MAGGGGVYSAGPTTVSGSAFIGNGAAGGGGLFSAGPTTISESTFIYNNTWGGGGGLWLRSTSTIMDSLIADNSTVHDGGGLAYGGNGTLVISNTTITRNRGNFGGGHIVGEHILILNSTITDNLGAGTVGDSTTVVMVNTLVARNTGPTYVPIDFRGSTDCTGFTSQGHNLTAGCPMRMHSTDLIGDPGLGPYTDDGTPGNGHFPLLPTSQAINAGDEAVCPKRDQLGEQRHKPCDIGAIEFQGKVMSSR